MLIQVQYSLDIKAYGDELHSQFVAFDKLFRSKWRKNR